MQSNSIRSTSSTLPSLRNFLSWGDRKNQACGPGLLPQRCISCESRSSSDGRSFNNLPIVPMGRTQIHPRATDNDVLLTRLLSTGRLA